MPNPQTKVSKAKHLRLEVRRGYQKPLKWIPCLFTGFLIFPYECFKVLSVCASVERDCGNPWV